MKIAVKPEESVARKIEFRVQNVMGEPGFSNTYNVRGMVDTEEFKFVKFREKTACIKVKRI